MSNTSSPTVSRSAGVSSIPRHWLRPAALAIVIVAGLILAWTSSGISVSDARQEVTIQPVGEITTGRIIGQTITAGHNGLNEIEVMLATYARRNTGQMIIRLLELPSGNEVAAATINLEDVQNNAFRRLQFSPIADSAGRQYRVTLETFGSTADNAITAYYSPTDLYVGGQADDAGNPLPGDLAFGTSYLYTWANALRDIASTTERFGSQIARSLGLFLIPGLFLLVIVGVRRQANFFELLGVACALTLSLLPLSLLWSTTLGLTLASSSTKWLLLSLAAGIICFVLVRRVAPKLRPISAIVGPVESRSVRVATPRPAPDRSSALVGWVALALFAMALWSRLFIAGDTHVGMWGDSYHHTMISQLIAERGRIPDSYLPYSQLTSFTYHYGFHSLVAFFHWATGLEVVWSVVIVGQILSALVVAGAYFLAVTLTRNRWAGLIAGLVAGLLSPMPAYYVNWGRYTQLAGQTILPFAIGLTLLAVEKARRRDIALAAILVGGVMVSHFRVAAFYFAFAGVFLLYEAVRLRSH
ncbi:MAG: hypothetical protein Q7O66_06175, partial [Dehalococcoidia bacterium]|nr:hypothetical protein [Dehalococcoidia bacterium]